jgi:hypothetical protein
VTTLMGVEKNRLSRKKKNWQTISDNHSIDM